MICADPTSKHQLPRLQSHADQQGQGQHGRDRHQHPQDRWCVPFSTLRLCPGLTVVELALADERCPRPLPRLVGQHLSTDDLLDHSIRCLRGLQGRPQEAVCVLFVA